MIHPGLTLLLAIPLLQAALASAADSSDADSPKSWNFVQSKENSPWIDPDTPQDARKVVSYPQLPFRNDEEREFDLVFSDEFNVDGRTMHDGRDPRWTALHKDDLTNNPLHWYSHDSVRTTNGVLNITLDVHPQEFTYNDHTMAEVKKKKKGKTYNVTKEFRSGMVQSWNKFCFTGGIIEMSAKLPGDPNVGGLWPAMWMMGNLARATYLDTTDHQWPFSTNVCSDQTRYSQEISACNDNPGYGMQPNRGRGAPELDFFEVMYMDKLPAPLLSASLQVAPGKPKHRPALGHIPNVTWYDPVLKNGAFLNQYFFGTHTYDPNKTVEYTTDSVSINVWLNESFYEKPHKYRIEWEPPVEHMENSPSALSRGGYIKWFIDDQMISAIVGDKLQEVSDTEIPSEPMYIIFNQALSRDWGFPDAYFLNCPEKCWSCTDPNCECAMPPNFCQKNMPASFEIDYVRIYQVKDNPRHILGCSPPTRPTAEWIDGHEERYVLWEDPEGTPPLQPIQRGGMECDSELACGGEERGYCDESINGCLCHPGWTGPNCLASYLDEKVEVDETKEMYNTQGAENEHGSDHKAAAFEVTPMKAGIAIAVFAGIVFAWRKYNKSKEGYDKIPDL